MYWADKLAREIPDKNKNHRIDDMKTVSGMPHVGSLRAVCTHDIVYQAMKSAGYKVVFSYVFNDMDPMDGLPIYLDEKKYRPQMGKPLYKIPSPVKGYASFGQYYALAYKKAFNKIGCYPEIIWSHELYQSGRMDKIVRTALDNSDKIRAIYKKTAGQSKPKNWHPYQVICPKCGKVGTTLVTGWDGTFVTYECRKDLVDWAAGCGHKGKIKPIKTNGKLMWKVDWPAHWKELNITVEGAGKEHFSKGGSRDIGVHICKEVFKTNPPFGFLHEFFLVGGRKMSSSKGTGVSCETITNIIPPALVRFLIVKTNLRRAVDFDPYGLTIPDLFDDFDRYANDYYSVKKTDYARIWQLAQIGKIPAKKSFYPRFRDTAKYLQMPSVDIEKRFAEIKGSFLSKTEKAILKERVKYAKTWLKNYAPRELVYQAVRKIPLAVKKLSAAQKKYLISLVSLLSQKKYQPEDLQQALYETAKKQKLEIKKAFQAIYLVLSGKNYGPKAGWFLLEQDKDFVIRRFQEASK